jgi:hypothetical protein
MLLEFITGRKYQEQPKILAEPRMMLVDAPQAPAQLSTIQQILLWINGLTLPTIIIYIVKGTRWFTKKEEGVKSTVLSFQEQLTAIKDNHLHTMQESLKEIQRDQTAGFKELVAATNQSKDAIVNAILLTKK